MVLLHNRNYKHDNNLGLYNSHKPESDIISEGAVRVAWLFIIVVIINSLALARCLFC